MSLSPALVQTQWAHLIVATLQQSGVATIVVSPGSRSAPLALAAARAQKSAAVVVIVDERSAGFYALGAARATGRPAALICTSGTAAAHYLPALIEAAATFVPLVVVTADRPPELHYCGAPQTIDQDKLFGGFTRACFLPGTSNNPKRQRDPRQSTRIFPPVHLIQSHLTQPDKPNPNDERQQQSDQQGSDQNTQNRAIPQLSQTKRKRAQQHGCQVGFPGGRVNGLGRDLQENGARRVIQSH